MKSAATDMFRVPPGAPDLHFATPRSLPRAADLPGRVVVLDLAFSGTSRSFRKTTGRFIEALGDRLALWVDHHDHKMHAQLADDPRFVLATKQEHPGCPEMIQPSMVERVDPVDTVVCHDDLDGVYAAAKWVGGGREPYEGADADARAVDSRMGRPSEFAVLVDGALRGEPKDELLRRVVFATLLGWADRPRALDFIAVAASRFETRKQKAEAMAKDFVVAGRVAFLEVPEELRDYDKTTLLLEGQKQAQVSIVKQGPYVTAAAAFDSGVDFVELLGLSGGMPTRVSVTESSLGRLLKKLGVPEGALWEPGKPGHGR